MFKKCLLFLPPFIFNLKKFQARNKKPNMLHVNIMFIFSIRKMMKSIQILIHENKLFYKVHNKKKETERLKLIEVYLIDFSFSYNFAFLFFIYIYILTGVGFCT